MTFQVLLCDPRLIGKGFQRFSRSAGFLGRLQGLEGLPESLALVAELLCLPIVYHWVLVDLARALQALAHSCTGTTKLAGAAPTGMR